MSIPVMSILYGVGGITCCGCGKSFVHTGTGGVSLNGLKTCIHVFGCIHVLIIIIKIIILGYDDRPVLDNGLIVVV